MASRPFRMQIVTALVGIGLLSACGKETTSDSATCRLAPELCGESDDAGGTGSDAGGTGSDVGGSDAGGSGSGGSEVDAGRIEGAAAVFILDLDCDVIWDLVGDACGGCDLAWDIDLLVRDATTCPFGFDTAGRFELMRGSAYWEGNYWAAASYTGGSVVWESAGYVYGGGGYTYIYAGAADYGP